MLQESSAEAGSSWTRRNILSSGSQLLLLSIFTCSFYLSKSPSSTWHHNLTNPPSNQLKEHLGKSFCASRVKFQQCGRNHCISQRHTAPLLVCKPHSLSLTHRTYCSTFYFLLDEYWGWVEKSPSLCASSQSLPAEPSIWAEALHLECLKEPHIPCCQPCCWASSTWEQQRDWECLKLPQKTFTKLICALLAVFDLPC